MSNSMEEAFRKAGYQPPQRRPAYNAQAPGQPAAQPPRAPVPSQPVPELGSDYVDRAESIMRSISSPAFTTTKIRSILSLVSDIYNQVTLNPADCLSEDLQDRLRSMRVRLAYECGREPAVRTFVQRTHLMVYLQQIGNSREKFLRFARYMEALVAYHRYFNGKD